MSKIKNILPLTIAAGAMFLSWLILRKNKQQTQTLTNNEDTDMRTNTMLPRGYRNNNPLNIRINADNNWQGKVLVNTDHVFEQFTSMPYGYRAALKLIRNYITNYGCNTVAKIIEKWAPPVENNTEKYIADVCKLSGLTPDTTIGYNSKTALKKMVYAMSIIENGNTDATREAGLPNMDIIEQGYKLL